MRMRISVDRTVRHLSQVVSCAMLSVIAFMASPHAHAAGGVAISQIYGGGGNAGATLRNDFVELFNRSASSVSLSGWCLEYASAAGTFTLGNNQNVPLSGSITPGGYYLVQLSQGTGGTQNLPAPDATGLTAMSATAGKLALLNSCATALGASEPVLGGRVVDFVGYGSTASQFEGAGPSVAPSNTIAILRANNGCQDSDNNQADFATGTPAPRNSASSPNVCSAPNAPVVPACPATVAVSVGTSSTQPVSANDADGVVVAGQITASTSPAISLTGFTPAAVIGGVASATLNIPNTLAVGAYSVTLQFSNADAIPQTGSCTIAINVNNGAGVVRIHDIQGTAHLSSLRGQAVSNVPGIVTARASNGFYFQDPTPDANDATSEGLFVFTSASPAVAVGDSVLVSGTVSEFRAGGSDGVDNLTATEITAPTLTVLSSGNSLPPPIVIGAGGRVPPQTIIDDDASGSVENSGTFDAATDGIDFYESLEGMRVQLNNVVAVGPTNGFGEIPVVGDNGVSSALRTPRGGLVIRPSDFNPERILLDDLLAPTPLVNVGDTAPVVRGVMDYGFGNFKLLVTASPSFANNGLTPEITAASTVDQLTIGSFNVENLNPGNPPSKFNTLASQIVVNLRAPDIVAVMEMQDNNGATNDTVVDATSTFQALITAIANAGGPTYQFRQINPVDDQDGGEPGGNIRVGFLFNPQRVHFIDRPGGTPTSATSVVAGTFGPQLSASPGRIDPNNTAFANSRKPLAGEFLFNGRKLFLIANHFNSKGGDDPLFGHVQPPIRSSEIQRTQQATIVANFVQSLRSADSAANIVVLGDLNDFQFSTTLTILKNASLVDLVETLPEDERYTYVFDGNSQVLDHILVSDALATLSMPQYDVVHVNSEFATQASDHEPEVVKLLLPLNEVTNRLSVQRSGLVLNRATQTFNGTVTLTNTSGASIAGPLQLVFDDLPAGVTLTNATGTKNGLPYLTVPAALTTGAQVNVPVQFSNPARVSITYTARVYSGEF